MSPDNLFNVRMWRDGDKNFILNSWLTRYRSAISARLVTDRVYFATQHRVIQAILDRPDLVVLIACSVDDPNQIYGYVVAESVPQHVALELLHWVYVKGPFRRFGIAKELLKQAIGTKTSVQYTHKTHLIEQLDKQGVWVSNPAYVWGLL